MTTNMRRSTYKKISFMLVFGTLMICGYYVYEMKVKTIYNKYSRLLLEQEKRERLQKIQNIERSRITQPVHNDQPIHNDQPADKDEDGRHHEIVNGVQFVIDQKHKPQDYNIDTHVEQNKMTDLDDNGNRIPDDSEVQLHPHGHDAHGHDYHVLEQIHDDGEHKKEREIVNGVEFLVEHNGDAADRNKESPNKEVEHNPNVALANEDKGNQFNVKLADIKPAASDIKVDAKPVEDQQEVQREDVNTGLNDDHPKGDVELEVEKVNLLSRLGIEGPIDDHMIKKIILSGQVSADEAAILMNFHSRHKRPKIVPPPPPNNVVPPNNVEETNPAPMVTDDLWQKVKSDLEMAGGLPYKSITVYDLTQQADLMHKCVNLKLMNDVTTVCINDPTIDKPISASLAERGVWEPQNLMEFQRALLACPTCGVVDLGSNLGVYSLIAAKAGRAVLAVEPHQDNINPFHKSVHVNNFMEQILLLKNAVSDKHGYMEVKYAIPPNNLGAVYAEPVKYKNALTNGIQENIVKAITLDDLPYVMKFSKAILKIDIQGAEHAAFKSSKTFLKKIDVPFIFMHWAYQEYKNDTLETAKLLINYGYKPKGTIGGSVIGLDALTRDQSLLIWTKQY